jgi:hypothetical protein
MFIQTCGLVLAVVTQEDVEALGYRCCPASHDEVRCLRHVLGSPSRAFRVAVVPPHAERRRLLGEPRASSQAVQGGDLAGPWAVTQEDIKALGHGRLVYDDLDTHVNSGNRARQGVRRNRRRITHAHHGN